MDVFSGRCERLDWQFLAFWGSWLLENQLADCCMNSYSWHNGFCVVFVLYMSSTKEPLQPYNLVSRLNSPFWSVNTCPPSTPASHPFVSTHDTSLACATGQIFYFNWRETLKAAKSSWGFLKGDKSMHLLYNFCTRTCYPWQAVLALNL